MARTPSRRELLASSLALPLAMAAPPWNHTVPLGRTGLEVTPLGLGCEDVKDPDIIRRAADLGVRYFHALSNLEITGQALRPVRDRVVLATGSNATTAASLEEALEKQLAALRTDRIDLWYLTSRHKPEAITDEALEVARRARQAGKIRALAVSTHGLGAVTPRLLELRDVIGAVMVVCNFATWERTPAATDRVPSASLPGGTQDDIIRLHKAGIGIASMKPMLGGLKYVPPERAPWTASLADDERRRAALSAALKWALHNPHLDTTPVCVADMRQLEANIKSAGEPFREADRALLAMETARLSPYYCRQCQRCEGACQRGLPVSDMLRYLMYADGYGHLARARREFRALPANVRVVRCGECSGCTVRCPSGVKVRQQLIRAQTLLA